MDSIKDQLEDYLHRARYRVNQNLRRKIEIIETLLALVIVALGIISILSYQFYKYAITSQISAYGLIGLFIVGAFLDLIPQVLNPFLAILAGIGAGLNPDLSILVVIMGSMVGSLIGFEFGRAYGGRLMATLFPEKMLVNIIDFWQKHGKIVVLVSALTPIPYIPLLFGALEMERKDLWLYGIIPRIISFAVVGYGYYFGLFQYNL